MRTAFQPAPGLDTDDTASVVDGGAIGWLDMDKARFWRGLPQTIGGWESFITAGLTGVCRAIGAWNDLTGALNVAFGTHTNLQVSVGGSLFDITPAGLAAGAIDGTGGAGFGTGTYSNGTYSTPSTSAYYPRTWSLANFGQTLIANPRGGPIYQWSNNTASPAVALTNAPTEVTFALVTPKRQVVAVGCNQVVDGVFNPMNIRGSDLEAPTSWTPSSTNNAWEDVLEGGSRLVAAHVVGEYLFVWSDTCLWQGQFVGDIGQTYRFTRLGQDCGLIGPNAVAIVDQTAFWISSDGNFRTCTLNGVPRLIVSPTQAQFFSNLALSQQDKIVAAYVAKFGEVWWFYPDQRDGNENSRYVSVSVDNGWWMKGMLARTAFIGGAPTPYPIGADVGGSAYYHEKGTSANGGLLSWFYESGGQLLGDGSQRVQIKGVWPDFQGQQGPVQLTIFTRGYPQDTERSKGPFALSPGQSKRDFLADGRLVRVRVEGSASPSFCRLGRLQFETEGTGLQ